LVNVEGEEGRSETDRQTRLKIMALQVCNWANKYWASAVIVKVNILKLKVIVKTWGWWW